MDRGLERVDVHWIDAVCTGGSEWQTFEEADEAIKKGPSIVRTCAYLVHECSEYIALCDTIITDGDATGYIHVIPKGMVLNIARLEASYEE